MNKEDIQIITEYLRQAESGVMSGAFIMDNTEEIPNHEKHKERLRKAQGLINKVRRDLGRVS